MARSPTHTRLHTLAEVRGAIVACQRCTRLREYCERVAREKKKAYRDESYWGKPVPGFGDPRARILILGLAPAAHGANRTGRVFTGDGAGGSGEFLMSALHRAGLANLTTSARADDGLRLRDVFIAAAVRCAPPDNKPRPEEIAACASHLDAEIAALTRLRVVVALGQIAWHAWLTHADRQGLVARPRPVFGHGNILRLAPGTGTPRTSTPRTSTVHRRTAAPSHLRTGTIALVGCYHPSRQNTNTGRVTAAMYDEVFARVRGLLR
jgi:uracil-DNA glycosylase family 4